MRWCSRSAAGDMSSSTDFAGPDSDTCGASEGGVPVHAAKTKAAEANAAAATAARANRRRKIPMGPDLVTMSLTVGQVDLFRTHRLDPRPAALLDPPAYPDMSASELPRFEARCRKNTRISLQDRNSEILGPPPPEIHIDRGAAFAHRHHLTLDQPEAASLGQHVFRIGGVQQIIIRIGPKAKFGPPRCFLAAEELRRAVATADPGGDAGNARGNQLRLHQPFDAIAGHKSIGEDPPISVGGNIRAPEHNLAVRQQRGERVFCRAATGRSAGFLGQRQWRSFNAGKANLAAVIKREGAPVDRAARGAAGNHVPAANRRAAGLLLRHGAGGDADRHTGSGQNAVPPPHRPTTPSATSEGPECGGTTAKSAERDPRTDRPAETLAGQAS